MNNLTPLRAFESSIRLIQSGSYPNVGNNDCCWANDDRGCDNYSATIQYSNAIYSSDIIVLKNIPINTIFQRGYIKSVNSSLNLNFTVCGGTCWAKTLVNYTLTYVDDTTIPSTNCYTSREYTSDVREAGKCDIKNNIKPIKSFYFTSEKSAGCVSYGIKDVSYTFETIITIDMKKYCQQSNFDNLTCINFCSYDDSATDCYNNALEYCFNQKPDGSIPILNNDGHCFKFLNQYASKDNTSIVSLDNKLKTLCLDASINASNYLEDPIYKDLCACHLQDSVYDNYYSSLLEKIPNLKLSSQGSAKCVFPFCNVSPFKSGDMKGTGVCPTAQCILGITLSNEGTINGDVTLNQDAKCLSYTGQTGGGSNGGGSGGGGGGTSPPITPVPPSPPSPSPPSPSSSNNLYWILGSLGIIIVLVLIVIFIIYFVQKRKKSSQ